MTRTLLVVLAVCFLAAVPSSATVVSCALAQADFVAAFAQGSGNFCNGGGFTTGNARLGSWGFDSVVVSLAGATIEDRAQSLVLDFATNPDPVIQHGDGGPGLRLWYTVSADDPINNPIQEVGVRNLVGSGILMIETACKSDFALNYGECPTGDLLGEIGVRPGFTADIDIPDGVSLVFLQKGFYFDDAHLSSVENYVGNNAPEPVTTALIGAGLVAMGLVARKKRRV